MRRFIFITLILFAPFACQQDKPGKEVLTPEVMVPLLVDLHRINAIQSYAAYREIFYKYDSVDTYSYVFEKHGLTKMEFDSSIVWYSSHPKIFEGIYDEVIMRLTLLADSIDPDRE